MYNVIGGYRIKDIEIVAAFDVDSRKVGKDVAKAIFSGSNCTTKFCDVPELGVEVKRAPIYDSLGKYLREVIPVAKSQKPIDVAKELEKADVDILINYLPVGSYQATRYYAKCCLKAGTALANAIPEFIASDRVWSKKFERENIPIAGDDIKSQIGATILHRTLSKLFLDRGVRLERSYQLNIGGNTDFYNMLEESRLSSKRISKTYAVQSLLPYKVPLRIGPSDYVEFLKDRKIAYIHLQGSGFGDVPLTVDIKLNVEDSPNSAGVVIDVVRALKLALDRKIGGALYSVCAYYFKHPPVQYPDDDCKTMVEEFVRGIRSR
jgi:myo-inositol-1-phosphate synthase